ncbi:hypothetical protein ACK8P5_26110 (plasmid) [Paenibacillus sp. EC2-1]|uniref:DUF5983 family protein n=1 Tax=Paenibacillus sp. EC2-1 TaxID=3388665 RepID=UPI003BEED3E6
MAAPVIITRRDSALKGFVVSMLDLSTAHLTPETIRRLNLRDEELDSCITIYEKGEFGWYIAVPERQYFLPEEVEGIPDELLEILKLAVKNDIDWIMFDCDANRLPVLPTFE